MPLKKIIQPDIITIDQNIRLRKYDGNYQQALIFYQDPYIYYNSEGILDDDKKPNMDYVKGMFEWLNDNGELYFIESNKNDQYITIGDVTIKDENPPICIWMKEYRNLGIGTKVMQIVIKRLKDLGYKRVYGSTVYKWNKVSQKMHEKLGFKIVNETEHEYDYELLLVVE